VVLEGEQALLDGGEVVEVVRLQDLALDKFTRESGATDMAPAPPTTVPSGSTRMSMPGLTPSGLAHSHRYTRVASS
jgi:hypothetical protein